MEAILGAADNKIQGFLTAGHVCTIMGTDEYLLIAKKFNAPIEISGFEPVDLLRGILELVKMLEAGQSSVENAYARVVRLNGNPEAQAILDEVYERIDKEWRGIGYIINSGLGIARNTHGTMPKKDSPSLKRKAREAMVASPGKSYAEIENRSIAPSSGKAVLL